MTKNIKKPAVRFKEFTDAWEQRKLINEVSSIDTGKSKFTVSESGDYEILGSTSVIGYDYSYDYEGDFILTARVGANAGELYRHSGKVKISDNTVFIQGEQLNFIFYTLQNFDIKKLSFGTGQPLVKASELKEQKILMPFSKQEREQIGSYFHNLDNLITLHQRKCDTLQKLKKSMLQKMFPQNDKSVPEFRFEGFTDAWEQRKVKDVCSISTGKSNTQDKIDDGIYPFYVRSPIIEKSNRYLYDEEAVLTVGDGVGTGKVYHYVNGKYDLHQRVYRMYNFSENMSAKYFYYFFSNNFYQRVMAMTAKTSVDSVRYDMIADMDIIIPSKDEQEHISEYFRNLDTLITLHQRKLETLNKLKKSMLQKMFV